MDAVFKSYLDLRSRDMLGWRSDDSNHGDGLHLTNPAHSRSEISAPGFLMAFLIQGPDLYVEVLSYIQT